MTNKDTDENKKNKIVKSFDFEKELKKEKKYLQKGFKAYIALKNYDVGTKTKYNKYMKEFKEA